MWPSDKKFGDTAFDNDTILSETQSITAKKTSLFWYCTNSSETS